MQLLWPVPEALSAQGYQGGPGHANLEAAYDLYEMRQVRAGMSTGGTGNGTEYSIDGETMALYALGDFHLSFGVRSRLREANLNGGDDLPGDAQAARGVSMDKPMDIFGRELPCMQGNSPTRRSSIPIVTAEPASMTASPMKRSTGPFPWTLRRRAM